MKRISQFPPTIHQNQLQAAPSAFSPAFFYCFLNLLHPILPYLKNQTSPNQPKPAQKCLKTQPHNPKKAYHCQPNHLYPIPGTLNAKMTAFLL